MAPQSRIYSSGASYMPKSPYTPPYTHYTYVPYSSGEKDWVMPRFCKNETHFANGTLITAISKNGTSLSGPRLINNPSNPCSRAAAGKDVSIELTIAGALFGFGLFVLMSWLVYNNIAHRQRTERPWRERERERERQREQRQERRRQREQERERETERYPLAPESAAGGPSRAESESGSETDYFPVTNGHNPEGTCNLRPSEKTNWTAYHGLQRPNRVYPSQFPRAFGHMGEPSRRFPPLRHHPSSTSISDEDPNLQTPLPTYSQIFPNEATISQTEASRRSSSDSQS